MEIKIIEVKVQLEEEGVLTNLIINKNEHTWIIKLEVEVELYTKVLKRRSIAIIKSRTVVHKKQMIKLVKQVSF